ncbi:hypothetical protein JCM3766R1_000565 [Sporobolomyces carnicolor]
MAGARVPSMPYHDSINLPSSPFPFSSFLSDSIFTLDSTLAPAQPPPVAQPHVQHQPGIFVHSKEINPFERSFAVIDSNPMLGAKPFAGGVNRNASGLGMSDLYLPSPKGKRKRALSSPALFTPGGTGEAIDDGTAQAFKQAKRPSLRLAPDGKGLPPIPGLARGLVDSSSSVALSDSTGSSRSNTSVSFDDDPNFRSKVNYGQASTTESPDSSVGLSPVVTKPPQQLRASSIDSFSHSSTTQAPPNFAHYQPQPIPFAVNPNAPEPAPPFHQTAARPFSSSTFATTTLAPASIAPPVVAPLANEASFSSFNPALAYTSTAEDSAFAFTDPFALVPQQMSHSTHYPGVALPSVSAIPLGVPPPPPHHFAPVASTSSNPTVGSAARAGSISFSKPLEGTSDSGLGGQGSAAPVPAKPTGKKRGRKPKNWDPSLEVEVVLEPEEAERQRKLALERNRIAASKSRRRKKEKVQALEGAAREYCEGNSLLQSQCQALLAEVNQLRAYLIQAHPQPGCKCQHVHGYFNREREGGGLNAIMVESKGTLSLDYRNVPRWGTEDDVYAGYEMKPSRPRDLTGGRTGAKAKAAGGKATVANASNEDAKSKSKAAPQKGAKTEHEAASEDDDDDDDDGDEEEDENPSDEESEEEKVALKSRRARAIPPRRT